jgi:hypothetical protein
MSMGEWSLAVVHDVLAATVPEREMVVCGGARRMTVGAPTRVASNFINGIAHLPVAVEADPGERAPR